MCGPIYTMAEIFEDPQYKAREMLVEHVDPEFGAVHRARASSPSSRTRPARCAGPGTWEEGSHNEEIFCGLLGLTDAELGALQEDGVV